MTPTQPTPGSQASLREANRVRLLDALKRHGRLTQVELAGTTGLSPATVSNIVKELSGSGVLTTSATSRSGRRATEVRLARRPGLVAGVHFSSRHLRLAIADDSQRVIAESHVPLSLDHRHDAELDRAALLLADMAQSLDARLDALQAVGLSIPAPVDPRTGRVAAAWLQPGWDGINVGEAFSGRIGRPVVVEGEASAGALAESRLGAARGVRTAVYVRAGYTIEAALLIDGRPFHGAHGKAGQLGHMALDENGPVCRCGNRGCLETFAAGPALLRLFPPTAGMHRLNDILRAAAEGDARALRVVADAGRHLGLALGSLVNLFDPEMVVVGGELAGAGEPLLSPLRHALARSALVSGGGPPAVEAAEFGHRTELLGTVALAAEQLSVAQGAAAAPETGNPGAVLEFKS